MNISNLKIKITHMSCITVKFDCDVIKDGINTNITQAIIYLTSLNHTSHLLTEYRKLSLIFKPEIASLFHKLWAMRGINSLYIHTVNRNKVSITIGIESHTTFIRDIARCIYYLITSSQSEYLQICNRFRTNYNTIYYDFHGRKIEFIYQYPLTRYKQQFSFFTSENIQQSELHFQCTRYGKKYFKPFLAMVMENENYISYHLILDAYKIKINFTDQYLIDCVSFVDEVSNLYPNMTFVKATQSMFYTINTQFNNSPHQISI